MKTGDKKQAVVLSLGAVLAIGFLGFQLKPKAKPNSSSPAAEAARSFQPVTEGENLPLTVIGNPFSHSKLATKALPKADPGPSKPLPPASTIDKSGGFSPVNPGDPGSGKAEGGPEETAGEDRYEEQVPLVTLTGLMSVDQPLAMLAVDNQDSKPYAVGDVVAEKTQLIQIGDGFVALRVNGTRRELRLGETLRPKKEQKR